MNERKQELIALKNSGGKSWNKGLQEELDDIVSSEFDLEEQMQVVTSQIDEYKNEALEEYEKAMATATGYVPEKGTEKFVHLKIVNGRRFNPRTGKEESAPYIQVFTPNEYNLFKQYHALIGYQVVEVLHDPTNTAEALISK